MSLLRKQHLLSVVLWLAILFQWSTLWADDNLKTDAAIAMLTTQLGRPDFLQGDFTQTRTIGSTAPPLASTGRFVYWQAQGLYWETRTPFFQATTYMPAQWITWSAEGQVSGITQNKGKQKYASRFMLSIFNGDWNTLAKMFHIKTTGMETAWEASLTPRRNAVADVLTEIRLAGSSQIKTVSVLTAAGEELMIRFSDVQPVPAQNLCGYFLLPSKDCPMESVNSVIQ